MKKDETKNPFTPEELEKAKALFKENPSFKTMWVTSDGQMFSPDGKRDAHAHGSKLQVKSLRVIAPEACEDSAKTEKDPK